MALTVRGLPSVLVGLPLHRAPTDAVKPVILRHRRLATTFANPYRGIAHCLTR